MNINLTCRMCGEPTGPGEDYCDDVCAAGAGKAPIHRDPEPLTRERAREWLESDADRISDMEVYQDGDEDRAALYSMIYEYAGGDREWDALADLLVDAAAGRIR